VLAQIRGAIRGGVTVVQIRERGLEDGAYLVFLRECVAVMRGTPCRIVVNDRLDLALAAAAGGVHLRESSVPVDAARRLAPPGFAVGRSVHDAATAAAARKADYMIAGSVFETESKPGQRASLGLEGLRQVVAAAGRCPVWAIGGITAAHAAEVSACGVQGIAAIGAFLPPAGSASVEDAARDAAAAFRT
jgi:thiamine-phosphate pyrophosphorylase